MKHESARQEVGRIIRWQDARVTKKSASSSKRTGGLDLPNQHTHKGNGERPARRRLQAWNTLTRQVRIHG